MEFIKLHKSYWNLVVGAIGIVLLSIIAALVDVDTVKNASSSEIFKSQEFKTTGMLLFFSVFPVLLDLLLDLFCFEKYPNKNTLLIGRIFYVIITFLVGFHLSFQCCFFSIFETNETCLWFSIWCQRLTFTSMIMFVLSRTNTEIFAVQLTVSVNACFCIFGCIQMYTNLCHSSYFIEIVTELSFYIWDIISVIVSMWWGYQLLICKTNSSTLSDYQTSIFYLILFTSRVFISMIVITFLYFNQYLLDTTGQPIIHLSNDAMKAIFPIFIYIFIHIIMAVIPGRIARSEVAIAKDNIILTKQAYVRYISHELRTPMNIMHIGVNYVLDNISKMENMHNNKKDREALVEVSEACETVLEILDDLLLYDKIENGKISIHKESVDLIDFVAKNINSFTVQVRAKEIKLQLHNNCTDGENIKMNEKIDVDKSKMSQVIRNLMSNAIKFTPTKGHIDVSISFEKCTHNHVIIENISPDSVITSNTFSVYNFIRDWQSFVFLGTNYQHNYLPVDSANRTNELATDIEADNQNTTNNHNTTEIIKGMLVIEFKDTGVGLSPETLQKVFDELIQFTPEKLQGGGGSGLGMSISKSIIDMHGGRISVHSEGEGCGSTFRIEIPMTRSADNHDSKDHCIINNNTTSTNTDSRYFEVLNDFRNDLMTTSNIQCDLNPSISYNHNSDSEEKDQFKNINGLNSQFCIANETSSVAVAVEDNSKISPTRNNSYTNQDVNIDMVSPASLPSTSTAVIPRKKLLIVDDIASSRKMMRRLLEGRNHYCEEAEDGKIALDMVQASITNNRSSDSSQHDEKNVPVESPSRIYDVVFMDFVMPNMNGPTSTKFIRESGYTGPIIGVTGNALPEDREVFMNAGATDVIIKPMRKEALLKIIDL